MAELEINPVEKEIKTVEELKNVMTDASLNKPTPEDIEKFTNEYNAAAKEFTETLWAICEPQKSPETLAYLTDFINNKAKWDANVWMGIIKFQDVIKDLTENIREGESLKIGYQPLEFLGHMMQHGVGGYGLKDALEFEKVVEQHGAIADVVMGTLQIARDAIKELNYLHDKVSAAHQGFYYEREEPVKDEPVTPAPSEEITSTGNETEQG